MTPYATPAHKELTHWGRDNMATICWQHFQMHFLERNTLISIEISLKFVPKGPIITIPALVQIMAWQWPGDKPLSEPMMVSLLMHICVTRPQWVNILYLIHMEAKTLDDLATFKNLCRSFILHNVGHSTWQWSEQLFSLASDNGDCVLQLCIAQLTLCGVCMIVFLVIDKNNLAMYHHS